MTLLQAWMVIGLPLMLAGLALFIGRSRIRAGAGYAVLLAGFLAMLPFDLVSALVFAVAIVGFVAAGRGGPGEDEQRRYHRQFGPPDEVSEDQGRFPHRFPADEAS